MKRYTVWLAAVGIGIVNAVLLFIFEFIGVDITDWLWNDLLQTDENRWLVIPVALILGLILTALIKALGGKRVVPPESDLMAEINNEPANLAAIGVVLAIGAMSLLAGGSVGPEASLMAASAAIGVYVSSKWHLKPSKQPLILASIGALLVSFVGSLVLAVVPLLIMFQESRKRGKSLGPVPVIIIILASLVSFITIQLIDYLTGKSGGYGTAPAMPRLAVHDFVIAFVLGFASGFLALLLNLLINRSWRVAKQLENTQLPGRDWLAGAAFALVLGILYLLGGHTVEFSGSIGSGLLVANAADYSAAALAGLIITKILATAWSKGTGYRGGLVFPSIYIGVALGLLAGQLFEGIGGAGAMIGGISGMLTAAIGSPVMGGIFLIAVLPYKLWVVALCAIAGTVVFSRSSKQLFNKKSG